MLASIKCANSSRKQDPLVPPRLGFLHLVLSLGVELLLAAFNRIMQYCITDSTPNWQKLQDLTL